MLANFDAEFTTEVLRDKVNCSAEHDRRQNSYRADKKTTIFVSAIRFVIDIYGVSGILDTAT